MRTHSGFLRPWVTISHPIVLDRTRIYVIGDIHGRSDLLDRMVEQISRDLDANPISDCVTVTLGDYIDRGPDSRGVLDRLVRNTFPTDLIALKGNHEALLQMFLDDPAVAEHWRRLGGLETLHSYGVPAACWGAVRHGRSRDYQLGRSKDAGSFFGNRRKLVDLM